MKPVITWVVLANARMVRAVVHRGPGKGLVEKDGIDWAAPDPVEYADRAGKARSSTNSATVTFSRSDPNEIALAAYAREIAARLDAQAQAGAFDRLIVGAAPAMLGALRDALDKTTLAGRYRDISKDLTQIPVQDLAPHLEDLLPV